MRYIRLLCSFNIQYMQLLQRKERKGIVIYYFMTYRSWSDERQSETGILDEISVPRDELFMRKLVDATVITGKLWLHLSNESDGRDHAVYVTDMQRQLPAEYGSAIIDAVKSPRSVSLMFMAEYRLWNGRSFEDKELAGITAYTMELAERLLDHYMVHNGATYEFVYSVLDTEAKKVLLFMKEVNL